MEKRALKAAKPPAMAVLTLALIAPGPMQPPAGRGSPGVSVAGQNTAARPWSRRTAEIEAYLRTAPVVRTERTGRGVTKPLRAFFAPGGPVGSMTWKALSPRVSGGFYESYKSEIAAYEIDKLLALGMVPPKVERRVDGEVGVAVMWIDGVKSFAELGGAPQPPPAKVATWNREVVRAKMFHNLIGEIDPNLGNWLIDAEWRITLIDQSRALTTTTQLVHDLQRIDGPLWTRMRALTLEELTRTLSPWLGAKEIRAILTRRDLMQKKIDRLPRQERLSSVLRRDKALVSPFGQGREEVKHLLQVLRASSNPEFMILAREFQIEMLCAGCLQQHRRAA